MLLLLREKRERVQQHFSSPHAGVCLMAGIFTRNNMRFSLIPRDRFESGQHGRVAGCVAG
jgi:hypothetical protein